MMTVNDNNSDPSANYICISLTDLVLRELNFPFVCQSIHVCLKLSRPWLAIVYYYALNKILNSDWLNTNLTLVDVWSVRINVRQRNLMSVW